MSITQIIDQLQKRMSDKHKSNKMKEIQKKKIRNNILIQINGIKNRNSENRKKEIIKL